MKPPEIRALHTTSLLFGMHAGFQRNEWNRWLGRDPTRSGEYAMEARLRKEHPTALVLTTGVENVAPP